MHHLTKVGVLPFVTLVICKYTSLNRRLARRESKDYVHCTLFQDLQHRSFLSFPIRLYLSVIH